MKLTLIDAAKKLGVDPEQLKMGIQIEKEHDQGDNLDVVGPKTDIIKIALEHLKEDPEYYTKLQKVEAGNKDTQQECSNEKDIDVGIQKRQFKKNHFKESTTVKNNFEKVKDTLMANPQLKDKTQKPATVKEAEEKDGPIEAHGVKGLKSTPWRKIFQTTKHMNAWVDKNDAEVHATRPLEGFNPKEFVEKRKTVKEDKIRKFIRKEIKENKIRNVVRKQIQEDGAHSDGTAKGPFPLSQFDKKPWHVKSKQPTAQNVENNTLPKKHVIVNITGNGSDLQTFIQHQHALGYPTHKSTRIGSNQHQIIFNTGTPEDDENAQ